MPKGKLKTAAAAEENHRISHKKMGIKAMEKWLWDAACSIRGQQDAPKFKDFILPLVFYKRLSDVFDDEIQQHIEEYGDREIALEIIEEDHKDALKSGRKGIVRFFVPQAYNWTAIRNHGANGRLGEFVTKAMRETGRLNPQLGDVLTKDFNEIQSGQRNLDDERLANLIEGLSSHRLGLNDTEPDILGRAYEYLLRKFAEGQGQSAGEFYTPKEVGWLMAKLLDPQPKSTVYDPTCGSGGLLIKTRMVFEEHNPDSRSKAPKLFGQESTAATFSIAKMNMFLHDYNESHLAIGDTLRHPKFASEGGGLTKFDYVIANPMWNQPDYDTKFYETDKYGRFSHVPPSGNADWGWVQHILASLNEKGKAAIILGTASATRGSGQNSDPEKTIRKYFIDNDLIECVVLLPFNLFYNTDAPGLIYILNKHKSIDHQGKVLFINVRDGFNKGKPKNFLTEDSQEVVTEIYKKWDIREGISLEMSNEEIAERDYLISPARYVLKIKELDAKPVQESIENFLSFKNTLHVLENKIKKDLPGIAQKSPTSFTKTDFGNISDAWELVEIRQFVEEYCQRAGEEQYEVFSCSKIHGIILQSDKFTNAVASEDTSRYKIVEPDMFVYDPMLLWSGSIGRNHYAFPGIVSPIYEVFRVNEDAIDIDYFDFILRSEIMLPFYESISDGTNMRRRKAKFEDFKNLWIPVPHDQQAKQLLISILQYRRLSTNIANISEQLNKSIFKKLLAG